MSENHLFYEKEIIREDQQRYIEKILEKYKLEPVTDELKQRIYDDLSRERYLGNITIPFKIIEKRDNSGVHHPYIEVLLDTRV
ncbi:MAG: hypothetical protein ACI9S8_002925 [Chlamydiales bacterium]|jgi:hypothetical protein